jgi:hypothetical protein
MKSIALFFFAGCVICSFPIYSFDFSLYSSLKCYALATYAKIGSCFKRTTSHNVPDRSSTKNDNHTINDWDRLIIVACQQSLQHGRITRESGKRLLLAAVGSSSTLGVDISTLFQTHTDTTCLNKALSNVLAPYLKPTNSLL